MPSVGAFAKARVAAAKIYQIIDHRPDIDRNNESGLELESVTGQVDLKEVDFSYPSRPDVKILNNFSLSVPAGKTIALVGSSGSGKSTVVSLIERFYDPISGTANYTQFRIRSISRKHCSLNHFLCSQTSSVELHHVALGAFHGWFWEWEFLLIGS